MEQSLLHLGTDFIRFGPVAQASFLFFDNKNRKVFYISDVSASGGEDNLLLVTVVGPTGAGGMKFSIPKSSSASPGSNGSDTQIFNMKFSAQLQILAVQRGSVCVEFYNFEENVLKDPSNLGPYVLFCKGKTAKIVGVEWVGDREILLITTCGLELYQLNPIKRSIRVIKVHNVNLNWFVYAPETELLVASTGTLGNVFHPFIVKPNLLTRLQKFEVDLAANPQPPRLVLLDRDVTIANLYNRISILVLRHNPRPTNAGAELLIYQLNNVNSGGNNGSPAEKTHVLKLGAAGRFAVHVYDNLVIVHQQVGQYSMIFDICYPPDKSSTVFNIHYPLFPMQSISLAPTIVLPPDVDIRMYSPHWVIFQPNIIIDSFLGYMWFLQIDLAAALPLFPVKLLLVEFLLRRRGAKALLLSTLRELLAQRMLSLLEARGIFQRLNQIVATAKLAVTLNGDGASVAAKLEVGVESSSNCLIVDQTDVYSCVLFPLSELADTNQSYLADVIIEYLLSLAQNRLTAPLFLHEALVNALVRAGQYEKLLHLFQYHVLMEAKPLAFLLLGLEVQFPPALQIAMDMLARLQVATDEIVEVLLAKEKILHALRFEKCLGRMETVDPLKFLEAADCFGDKQAFYSIFRFFEQRHLKVRGTPQFAKGELYEKYLREYRKWGKVVGNGNVMVDGGSPNTINGLVNPNYLDGTLSE